MRPLTKKRYVSPLSSSKKASLPGISAKSRSGKPGCKTRTPPRSRQNMKKASVRGLAVPNKTSNQSSASDAQHALDQLAFVAAILALIAAAIGLYIAWKTLSLPGDVDTVVPV